MYNYIQLYVDQEFCTAPTKSSRIKQISLGTKLPASSGNCRSHIAVSVTCWAAVQAQFAERPTTSTTPHLSSTFLFKNPVLSIAFRSYRVSTKHRYSFLAPPAFTLHIHGWELHCNHRLHPNIAVPLGQLDLLKGMVSSYWIWPEPATLWY